jgi:ABC-type lipoprotein release transport system permease subunit
MVGQFVKFLFLNVLKNKTFHLFTFLMFALLVFIVSAALFVKSSIVFQTQTILQTHPEFVVSKLRGGTKDFIDEEYLYEFDSIFGVNGASGRVYGTYVEPLSGKRFTLVGIDPFDEIVVAQLQSLLETFDVAKFLHDGAIIGGGVAQELQKQGYKTSYNFLLYEKGSKKVTILGQIPPQSAMSANDLIIVSKQNAREILGIEEGSYSDIVLKVDNELEFDTIKNEILSKYRNVDVVVKEDLIRAYNNSYDFKSGLFLMVFILCVIVFAFILYFKYSFIASGAKKEIGILRALGWSISQVLGLKFFESFFVASSAFMFGFLGAFLYVYAFDAYLFKEIFLGHANLTVMIDFTPRFEASLFMKLYLFLVSVFCLFVLVPTWKLSISSAKEAMK